MSLQYLIRFFFTFALLTTGCSDSGNSIETIKKQGELVVLTRNASTTLYEGRDGPEGPEHDLIMKFAEDHNLQVRFQEIDSINEILNDIQANKGHIAAAGITRTEARQQEGIIFGPGYQEVVQQVVCRRNAGGIPKGVDDLIDSNIAIIANSSYHETLIQLKNDHPELEWQVVTDTDTEQLLEQVWKKQIDCTVADSTIVSVNRRYHPELVVAFSIGEPQTMSWIISPQWESLDEPLKTWFEEIQTNGFLDALHERYYGHVEIFDYVDMRKFVNRIQGRLPEYKDMFKTAAKKHNIPWTLLAAQGYQESHWRSNAKSPTGVRGIMMLTLTTARSVGVTNRLDAKQSINGGAKYLRKMVNRIPEEVKDENRLWYALAAYNIGYGHLNDARILAKILDKDPNQWVDLKDVLPLLSQKKYYKTLKHGYARGSEPVLYVQRIRNYQQVLEENLK